MIPIEQAIAASLIAMIFAALIFNEN